MTEPRVSFVVIGLNEAAHLRAAVGAVRSQELPESHSELIYVDSGSGDGSLDIAREAGVDALHSIARAGASAAKARNLGLAQARGEFVQFVDGDTQLEPGWIARALAEFESDPALAGVDGHLREARPEASLLHAVCELDWSATPGPADFVGGNSIYRRTAIQEVGGFDERMRVGEEPELGFRMRAAGARFAHLDAPMAVHDLDMHGIGDYWRRGRASGLACAWVALATGGTRCGYWHERLRTTSIHAAWQVLPLLAAPGVALAVGSGGAALCLGLLPFALLALLALRKAAASRRLNPELPAGLALAYGVHSYVFKVPSALGVLEGLRRGLPERAE